MASITGNQTPRSFAQAPAGQSDARFGTSAAWAQAEASTHKLSNEVAQNAATLQSAAAHAASEAQEHEPQVVSAVNQLEAGRALEQKTNEAVAQGMFDVQSAKNTAASTAASAVQQAKNMANSAYQTAQSLFNGSAAQSTDASSTNDPFANDFTSKVQSTASSAYQTGKEYLASAQTAVQPQVDKAKDFIGGSNIPSQPNATPASTAPLESGQHTVSSPYPATTTGQSVRVGEV
ncbi:hypothetical protein WOLCODRAFT_148048 [Wolfiporia cocos MD-104 SS10]|uniref:Uncharacterized protein n=1 Tax=Wolfiporia cocos (strain MD-104) TaxID=742152 RepID=A0A2H3IVI8_WOLCO|nr:hypothetical protein WOLCODRAFT_148048 [Wolfiporia cocos MD-104 SS10]